MVVVDDTSATATQPTVSAAREQRPLQSATEIESSKFIVHIRRAPKLSARSTNLTTLYGPLCLLPSLIAIARAAAAGGVHLR
eukprot:SAG31_NODE_1082_length_10014_cov_5.324962_6_plen_82_part_00